LDFANPPAQQLFATNVFNKQVMKDRLPKPIYKSLMKTVEAGEKLDPEIADIVASDALPELDGPGVKELFTKYNVLNERELESRLDIYLEQYCKTVSVEAKLTVEMAKTLIFPAAIHYQTQLAAACANLAAVGIEFDMDTLERITESSIDFSLCSSVSSVVY
jgi:glutamine synthetase type III